jgi:hypothetical protein
MVQTLWDSITQSITGAPSADDIRRRREDESAFSSLYDAARQRDAELAAAGRRPVLGGLLSKEPVAGMDTLRYEGITPLILGLLSPVARAVDAPMAAYQGNIPMQDMAGEALGTAGMAALGGAALTRPAGSVGMGGRVGGDLDESFIDSAGGFAQYLSRVNPTARRIPAENRPNLGMGDMYGMLPRNARKVSERDGVSFYRGPDGETYATAFNPDVGEMDVVGYAMPGGDMVDLAVVNEMQGRGIGSELQYLMRRENPYAQTGGLTDAGEASLRRTYERLRDEGIVSANRSAAGGLLASALPDPRNEAEAMARNILEMRAAGRAGDVTEEMRAAADPMYMYQNTPLPMDEASRMARAREMGRRDEFHGTTTGSDMVAPNAFRGTGARQGIGFVTSDNPYVASSYADPNAGAVFPMLNVPLPANAPRIDVGGNVWSDISVDTPVTIGDRVVTARQLSAEPADVGGVLSTNQLSRGASFDYPGIEFANIMDRSIHAPRPRTDDGMEIMREFQRLASDPSNVTMRQDTRGMRSRFALFDPEFAHLRNLSAGVGGLGLLGLGAYDAQQGERY